MQVSYLILASVLFLPNVAGAQSADSAAFHGRQWGTEFNIGGGFAAAGMIRFSSPTRALIANVGTDLSHSSSTYAGNANSGSDVGMNLRLGARAYHAVGSRVYRLTTVGLSLNYTWQQTTQGGSRFASQGIGAGVFGDIGATWLVTPHLGLGARFAGTVMYNHYRSTEPGSTARANQVRASVGSIALVGQFYF